MINDGPRAGQSPAEKERKAETMKAAERAGRLLLTALALAGALVCLLPTGGISVYAVLSGSMEPEIPTGGLVFTNTKDKTPREGDIITYRLGEVLVTHRVVGKENGAYITRGDANNGADPAAVEPEQIVGTVTGSVPFLGYAAVFLKQKTVCAVLVLMLAQELVFAVIHRKGERRQKLRETKI